MAALTDICSKYTKRKPDESKVDLTPMLDVVFILLIFFVVTTIPFEESSMPIVSQAPLPEQPLNDEEPDNILIQVLADNRIVFNGEPVSRDAIRARVAQVRAQNPGASVMVKTDSESVANTLVEVMNAARSAGVRDVRVME